MTDYDVVIVGGGCVGLSTAKHLAERSGLSICVLEKEDHLAAHQSGRNSGVLHPGYNYEPGSLKARFSTEGTRRMKEYCPDHGVSLREFGVCVVAQSDAEEERLHDLQDQADENGVETELLDRAGLAEHEPHASGRAALHCPEAASVDAHQYTYALARDARAGGVDLLLGHGVTGLARTAEGHHIDTSKGALTADYLVNAAGLYADRIAERLGVGAEYQVVPFRGEYYEIATGRRDLVNTMVYPTPDPELPFLGVHFTRRADDRVIVGPNAVLAFGREAYDNTRIDPGELGETVGYRGFWKFLASTKILRIAFEELYGSYSKSRFTAVAQELVPAIEANDLVSSYAGIRAQLVNDDGDLVQEPVFEEGDRSLHVLNAVSPGLTSSLPLGEHLADRVIEAI